MGRFGDSEKELSGAVLFLLNNDAASFITGVIIVVQKEIKIDKMAYCLTIRKVV